MTRAEIERVARSLCAKHGNDPDTEVLLPRPWSIATPKGQANVIVRSQLVPLWRCWDRVAEAVLEERGE